MSRGESRVSSANAAAVPLTATSARPVAAARKMPSATTSGWYTGGAGRAGQPMWDGACEKNGVLTAGGNTVLTRMRLRSIASSACNAWLKPRTAAFAPEYDVMTGRPWKAAAEHTLTIVPRPRGRISASATRQPLTVPP